MELIDKYNIYIRDYINILMNSIDTEIQQLQARIKVLKQLNLD